MTTRPLNSALVMLLFGIFILMTPALANATDAGPFRQGSMRLSIMFGSGRAFQQDYSILGAGLGYYVADGIEAGFEFDAWSGNDPRINRVSPQLLYVYHQMTGNAKPYAGVFYRRVIINQYKDLDDAGARAGLLFLFGRQAYLGLGLVYDAHLHCDRVVWDSCADAYPELRLAIMF